MDCPSCDKETAPDSFFCHWCSVFIPAPEKGVKAGLFRRYFALQLDPLIAFGLYFLGIALLGGATSSLGMAFVAALVLPFIYLIWWLSLFRKGQTPGKKMLSVQVVRHQTGSIPGFGKMFVREVIGKSISVLFLGLGIIWAFFDKNNQAWHDKLAGTVVIKATGHRKAVSNEPQQRQQQIESGPTAAELPEESSAAEAPTNLEKSEHSMPKDTGSQTNVNRQASTLQDEPPSRRVRSSSSTESSYSIDEQSQSEDQHESQSSSYDEHEGEWMGDEYWKREDDESG